MRTRKVAPLVLLTAAALAAAACAAARAEPRPLWEFGLGAGALVFNDYRGAATVHVYPVPVPYLVYRGKFLRSNHRYDDYFYSVAPQYATADRPAFQAHGGYAGTQFIAALTRRYPSCWLGAYLRHDTLAGASFADSPLIRRDRYWSGGFGVAWIIRRSSRLVDSEDRLPPTRTSY